MPGQSTPRTVTHSRPTSMARSPRAVVSTSGSSGTHVQGYGLTATTNVRSAAANAHLYNLSSAPRTPCALATVDTRKGMLRSCTSVQNLGHSVGDGMADHATDGARETTNLFLTE